MSQIYRPMPSPNGTNHAKLYVPAGRFAAAPPPVTAAYDAMPPLSANMTPEMIRRIEELFKRYANSSQQRVSEDDDPDDGQNGGDPDQHWVEKVLEFCEDKLDPADKAELQRMLFEAIDAAAAMDGPPRFSGQPQRGGRAMDSRRLAHDGQANERNRQSFEKEWPSVARIKIAY